METTLTIAPEKVPLEKGVDGVIRMRGSRVTLDTIVFAFQDGATAEEITQQYPTLSLADIYGAVAYYLRHEEEVDAYLKQRGEDAEGLRNKIEAHCDTKGVRARLMARKTK